jgi:hypothetical protein
VIGTPSGSVADNVITVGVPSLFNAYDASAPVVIVGDVFSNNAISNHPFPVARNNLLSSVENALVPGTTLVSGRSVDAVIPNVVGAVSGGASGVAADQELVADAYLNVRPYSMWRSSLDGDVGNVIICSFYFNQLGRCMLHRH